MIEQAECAVDPEIEMIGQIESWMLTADRKSRERVIRWMQSYSDDMEPKKLHSPPSSQPSRSKIPPPVRIAPAALVRSRAVKRGSWRHCGVCDRRGHDRRSCPDAQPQSRIGVLP